MGCDWMSNSGLRWGKVERARYSSVVSSSDRNYSPRKSCGGLGNTRHFVFNTAFVPKSYQQKKIRKEKKRKERKNCPKSLVNGKCVPMCMNG